MNVLWMWCACIGVSLYAVFKKFLKNVLKIHGDKELIWPTNILVRFCVRNGQILVRSLDKIGQIFKNFSQILIFILRSIILTKSDGGRPP